MNQPESNSTPQNPSSALTIEFREGKQHPDTPPNFLVLMKVMAQDGTEYAVGYIKEHFPRGLPWIQEKGEWLKQPTFRRISLKTGEKRQLEKFNRAMEVLSHTPRPLLDNLFKEDPLELSIG